jgi:hypothetical protein
VERHHEPTPARRSSASTLERAPAGIYISLDRGLGRSPTTGQPREKTKLRRRRLLSVLVIVVAFGAGGLTESAISHGGTGGHTARVVIGQQVVRSTPARRKAQTPPSTPPDPLNWGTRRIVDPGYSPQSVSCPSTTFCVMVDDHGHAAIYQNQLWTAPTGIDGAQKLNSVSCPSTSFCVAVDSSGDALTYDGSKWSPPDRIDKTTFGELTSISCSSPSFCAAVDRDGNGLIYNGHSWSSPQPADAMGWDASSRDLASLSCPADGFCVGIDPDQQPFYYAGSGWQGPSNIDPSAAPPATKYKDAISCASSTFCTATANLGEIAAYNGTQWASAVPVDPGNYIESLSCSSTTFCAAVDGLLPDGFSAGSGTGQVSTYNGISWSAPQTIDDGGIITGVSCPTNDFCEAVDQAGYAITGTAPLTTAGPNR